MPYHYWLYATNEIRLKFKSHEKLMKNG